MNDNKEIEGYSDFLVMPDADSVLSTEDQNAVNMLAAPRPSDFSLVTDEPENDESEKEETDESADTRTEEEIALELEETKNLVYDTDLDSSTKNTSNGNIADMFQELIKDEFITPFEDDKELSEYTKKDFIELLKANVDDKVSKAKDETPKEFFESLPQELQYAAMHVAKGNTDLKSVFKALSEREEIKELDPTNESHVETIARQYLQATNFGSGDDELIEDQIQEWIENGNISKKAQQFKPKLDKMQEQILEQKLKKQEEFQLAQSEKRKTYVNDVYGALENGELNGIKINNKTQNFLFNELTTTKYQSMNGKPTNLLGKLLEEHQYGEKPRMDLIAEVTWLLSDPEAYKEQLTKRAVSDTNLDTAKKLKTEQSRKLKSTTTKEVEDNKIQKKKAGIKRPQRNIFSNK